MCTSFLWRSDGGALVGMNFDFPDRFKVEATDRAVVVHAAANGRMVPSFGVTRDGTFVNHLAVDDKGQGSYRRLSKTVTHTPRLVANLLSGDLVPADLDDYLSTMTVTNVPGLSVHCLITDRDGNAWVVEPGRSTLRYPAQESPFVVMTNFSLCDLAECGEPRGSGVDRYTVAETMLRERPTLDVDGAFEILAATTQHDGDWPTAFSLVYSAAEGAVYTSRGGDLTARECHTFAAA